MWGLATIAILLSALNYARRKDGLKDNREEWMFVLILGIAIGYIMNNPWFVSYDINVYGSALIFLVSCIL